MRVVQPSFAHIFPPPLPKNIQQRRTGISAFDFDFISAAEYQLLSDRISKANFTGHFLLQRNFIELKKRFEKEEQEEFTFQ